MYLLLPSGICKNDKQWVFWHCCKGIFFNQRHDKLGRLFTAGGIEPAALDGIGAAFLNPVPML